jgi:hypothetical protein
MEETLTIDLTIMGSEVKKLHDVYGRSIRASLHSTIWK